MAKPAIWDRSAHKPVGQVRTGLQTVHGGAFRTRHLKAGSRAFDVMFRFVWGVPLGLVLASGVRGGWTAPVVFETFWPHHPVSDSVALGLLVGTFFAPFVLAYFRAQEKFARLRGEERPEFRWVGRRAALMSFCVAWVLLWQFESRGVSLR